jgi:hypothetical protein
MNSTTLWARTFTVLSHVALLDPIAETAKPVAVAVAATSKDK